MTFRAIRVAGLGKRYRLGERRARYRALRDVIAEVARLPLRAFRAASSGGGPGASRGESIWALRGVSFEVSSGEVVGVIGRNGSGKSTLLKILSRITEPTTGVAEIHGRVGSLLEVGTGFHPELTGSENIYLNGVILGMRRREIERKFDEIVAFAGVDKFVDTPVKHYSSGMYLRLAFSVAAHLEPEILLVDEVLAVGDSAFQRKCLDKMEEVGKQGRTVLFVSHNMPAITRLCQRTLLLDEGGLAADGASHQVVSAYLTSGVGTSAAREWPELSRAPGNEVARLRAVRVLDPDGAVGERIDIRHAVRVEMEYDVLRDTPALLAGFDFFNEDGVCLFSSAERSEVGTAAARTAGIYRSEIVVPGNFLAEGTVFVNAEVFTLDPHRTHFLERQAVAFRVVDSMAGDSVRGQYTGDWPGVVRPMLEWSTEALAVEPVGSQSRRADAR